VQFAGGVAGPLHLVQRVERQVHRVEVALHHGLAALAVGRADRTLDGRDGFLAGEHARQREEARLHDGVDS